MSQPGAKRKAVKTMTEYTSKTSASAAPATTTLPFVAERHISPLESRLKALETKVFDMYVRNRMYIECGSAAYELFITEQTTDVGKHTVICRITDETTKTTYSPRGRAAGAVQIQAVGWLVDLTDIDQVKAVLQDRNNPEPLKEVIKHLIKGDIDVGDPHAKRYFNNVRFKILNARRKNDREVMREIAE